MLPLCQMLIFWVSIGCDITWTLKVVQAGGHSHLMSRKMMWELDFQHIHYNEFWGCYLCFYFEILAPKL